MKKIFYTVALMLMATATSFGQTESNQTKEEPQRKSSNEPKKVGTVKDVKMVKTTEESTTTTPQVEKTEVRSREKLRPAPKAVHKIQPVEKTEKTVE